MTISALPIVIVFFAAQRYFIRGLVRRHRQMTFNCVAVGDNCLDVYLTKDAMTVGGNALNVAVHWRRAGLDARYFGAVGRDGEGDIILEETAKAGLSAADIEMPRRPYRRDPAAREARRPADSCSRISASAKTTCRPTRITGPSLPPTGCISAPTPIGPLVHRLVADRVPFSVDVSTAHFALPLDDVPIVFASGPDDARRAGRADARPLD